MNNTLKYIAFGIALLTVSVALNAQGTYHREGGMATSKTVTGPSGGYYTITLESFATGKTTVSETGTPVDIVLVLDVSGSMSENLYTYTARDSQGYSYNSYGNNTYYYLHSDGNYYAVNRNDGRRLRFQVGNTWWYLTGTSATTNRPNQASNNNSTIWTGVLYTRASKGTKLANLKTAVAGFVDEVFDNAIHNSDGSDRTTPLTNQIAVVKYAMNRYYGDDEESISAGDHSYRYSYNLTNANYTEVVVGFTDVSTQAGVNTVMGEGNLVGVDDLHAAGATASDYGMTKAKYLLETVKDRESNKIVVLFTDGEPTYGNNFDDDVANNTIDMAKTLKDDYDATVFTIGVFDTITDDITTYMNYTSSNYPHAEDMDTPGSGGSSDRGYYQNASGNDLSEIFKQVAHASAASDATVGASTQVRDVVSNSFILPDEDAAQITIKIAEINTDGRTWKNAVPVSEEDGITYDIKTVTASDGKAHDELVVSGFDYTLDDQYNPEGFTVTPGNWVGERYRSSTDKYWAGKKLIIEFKIQANPEATGGDGSATNHPDSGVYVQKFNEDGTPVLVNGQPVYDRINKYDVPHTPLPLLIKISKDGLRHGESATFQLLRVRPKGWNDDGDTLEEKMANVEYNAIGKPEPDLHAFDPTVYDREGNPKPGESLDPNDPMDYLEGIGWKDWSKVILTNKGKDKAVVLKTLYGLDPGWVYMVVEDDWGWAYTLTGESSSETTSTTELNPFSFTNREKAGVVKHAEAVTINHFTTGEDGSAREEHYKSSKTNF